MINRILERLEEEKQRLEYQKNFFGERKNEEVVEEYGLKIFQMERVLKIVQEVAKEYDAFDVIYKKACELENEYVNQEDWENVNSCIRLENLLQYFKEELKAPYQKGE